MLSEMMYVSLRMITPEEIHIRSLSTVILTLLMTFLNIKRIVIYNTDVKSVYSLNLYIDSI